MRRGGRRGSLAFWEQTVFEVLCVERSRNQGDDEGWGRMGEAERAEQVERENNLAFGQISAVVMQMLDMGGVAVVQAVDFIKKMQLLELLQLPMHVEMLGGMLSARGGVRSRPPPDTRTPAGPVDCGLWPRLVVGL
jgi:hypothetical protein